MSTDVLKFDPGMMFNNQAFKCYLWITVPFMVVTFVAAGASLVWERRQTRKKRAKAEAGFKV